MRLIFATNNQHKVLEINQIIPNNFHVLSLAEALINIDIPEPHDTFIENAREKARTIYDLFDTNCFSEDSGLEVIALNGEPGVSSAHYAGEGRSTKDNILKLLHALQNIDNRKAQFKTVICLIFSGSEYIFEGICEGNISKIQKGYEGFGYDPVFIPNGSEKTFAEMSLLEKNEFSHRKKAIDKLVAFLNNVAVNK